MSDGVQRAVKRWLALEVDVVSPSDAESYVATYRRCIGAVPKGDRLTRTL